MLPASMPVVPRRSRHAWINLGGLRNPYFPHEACVSYARLMLTLVPAAAHLYPRVGVAMCDSLVAQLHQEVPAARTVSPQEAQRQLGGSALAIMTPGLGNIYEAAALAARVFWLPPANATQGLQLTILRREGLAPFAADWHDILPGQRPIDYHGPEPEVLESVVDAIHRAARDPAAADRLRVLFLRARQAHATPHPLRLLHDRFGIGGARVVAETFARRVLLPLTRSADHPAGRPIHRRNDVE
jgi:hypothetical protein